MAESQDPNTLKKWWHFNYNRATNLRARINACLWGIPLDWKRPSPLSKAGSGFQVSLMLHKAVFAKCLEE